MLLDFNDKSRRKKGVFHSAKIAWIAPCVAHHARALDNVVSAAVNVTMNPQIRIPHKP